MDDVDSDDHDQKVIIIPIKVKTSPAIVMLYVRFVLPL